VDNRAEVEFQENQKTVGGKKVDAGGKKEQETRIVFTTSAGRRP
jgi:hypothetical protein